MVWSVNDQLEKKQDFLVRACSFVARAFCLFFKVLLEAQLFYRVKWWQSWIVVSNKAVIEALALDVVSK